MTAVFEATVDPLLAAVEVRAGASDLDREAWLTERACGITATQVRDLWKAKVLGLGNYRRLMQELIDVKLGRVADAFHDSKYPAWGRKREPVIADRIAWDYGIAPEHRVFHAVEDPRWLASPDGIGVFGGVPVVSEIKTSRHDLTPGGDEFVRSGYLAQMIWQMLVLGFRRCLFSWEQHNDDWVLVGSGWPEPSGILHAEDAWLDFDEELAGDLKVIAGEFLTELDRQTAGAASPFDGAEFEADARDYLAALNDVEDAKARLDAVKARITDRIDGREGFKVQTSVATLTWVTPKPRRGLDEEAWARRAPRQHAAWLAAKKRYVKETPVAASLRVTPVKGQDA